MRALCRWTKLVGRGTPLLRRLLTCLLITLCCHQAARAQIGPPPAPTGLSATAGNQLITLSWSSVPYAAYYTLKRSTVSGGPYVSFTPTMATNWADSSVLNGTTYYYVVSSTNDSGESLNSAEVSATPHPFALFVGTDTTTRGSWVNMIDDGLGTRVPRYGTEGWDIFGETRVIDTLLATSTDANLIVWQNPAVGSGALVDPWELDPTPLIGETQISCAVYGDYSIAAGWAGDTSLHFYTGVNGTVPQKLSLYFLDWTNAGGFLTVQIQDPSTHLVLDTEQVSNFVNGVYLTWLLQGSYEIVVSVGNNNVTNPDGTVTAVPSRGSPGAVVSGVFLDPGPDGGNNEPGPIPAIAQPCDETTGTTGATTTGGTTSGNQTTGTTATTGTTGTTGITGPTDSGGTTDTTGTTGTTATTGTTGTTGTNDTTGTTGAGIVLDIPLPGWAMSATPSDGAGGGGAGPSSSVEVSLPAGVMENYPGPDITAYNPVGPSVSYRRMYRSAIAANGYSSSGLSPGWVDNFDITLQTDGSSTWGNLTLVYPNGAGNYKNPAGEVWTPAVDQYGSPNGDFNLPAGTPYLATGSLGDDQWYELVMTLKDHSSYHFKRSAPGSSIYRLSEISNAFRHSVFFNRDSTGRLLNVTNDAAYPIQLLSFFYASDGTLQRVAAFNAGYVDYTFGPAAGSTCLTGVNQVSLGARRWQYGYIAFNGEPFLNSVEAPNPNGYPGGMSSCTIAYDASGRVQSLRDASGRGRSYSYGAASVTVQAQNADASVSQQWSEQFDPTHFNVETGYTDANGASSTMAYADPNNPYLPTLLRNANYEQTTASYDQYGNIQAVTDPRFDTVSSQMDYSGFALGQLIGASETADGPSLKSTTLSYYGTGDGVFSGQVKQVSSPMPGTVFPDATTVPTTITYDTLGNVTQVSGPGAGGIADPAVVTYGYTDGPGGTEALGEPTSIQVTGGSDNDPVDLPGSTTVHYTYLQDGLVGTMTDALNWETDYLYNSADQLTRLTYPNGQFVVYTYLYPGGPLTEEDIYDVNSSTPFRSVHYSYGAEGELISVSGDTLPMSYTYDGLYRTTGITDGNGSTIQYIYDPAGNLGQINYPGGDHVEYGYDSAGNLTSRTDGNGAKTFYVRNDPESLLTEIDYPTPANNVYFGYDAWGRRRNMQDLSGQTSYTYDDLDNPLSVTTSFTGGPTSQVISYGYFPDGSRSTMTTPAGELQYVYDGVGHVAGIGNGPPPFDQAVDPVRYSYDADGRLSGSSVGGVNPFDTFYQYDSRGFLTELQATDPYNVNDFLSDFRMTYDPAGNRLSMGAEIPPLGDAPDASRNVNYVYDHYNQLIEEQSLGTGDKDPGGIYENSDPYNENYDYSFQYDLAGNPKVFKGGVLNFNPADQFTTGFGYDHNGNPTDYLGSAFSFDPESQLTAITGGFQAVYNGDGLRAIKTAPATTYNGTQQPGYTRYFLYDGDQPVVEDDDSSGYTGADKLSVYGPDGLRENLHPIINSTPLYYFYDPQGSLAERIGSNNAVDGTDAAVFDAFGALHGEYNAAQLGSALLSPEPDPDSVGFGGQYGYYSDTQTGLVMMTHRYYDAGKGRFINRDPIGAAGGINLYGFVGNNPVTGADPSGYSDETSDDNWFVRFGKWLAKPFHSDTGPGIGALMRRKAASAGAEDGDGTMDVANAYGRAFHAVGNHVYGSTGYIGVEIAGHAVSEGVGALGDGVPTTARGFGKDYHEAKGLMEGWAKDPKTGRASDMIRKHFSKHGGEVGSDSNVLRYMRQAKAFSQQLRGIRPSPVEGDTPGVLRYVKQGKYIDLAPGGKIVSFGLTGR